MTPRTRVEKQVLKKSKGRPVTEADVIDLLRIGRRIERARVRRIVRKEVAKYKTLDMSQPWSKGYVTASMNILAALRGGR